MLTPWKLDGHGGRPTRLKIRAVQRAAGADARKAAAEAKRARRAAKRQNGAKHET